MREEPRRGGLRGAIETAGGQPREHRHGQRVHSHPHRGPHRHVTAPRLSEPVLAARRQERRPHRREDHLGPDAQGEHAGGQDHSHGLVHKSIKRSREGIRAVAVSLGVLGLAALAQTAVFIASGSVALLADLIHNFGDALTAVPLGIAFALRSATAERRSGLAVVAAIFISACAAGAEAIMRLLHPTAPRHLAALALAGAIGYAGNLLAARIRTRAGRRLASPALIADGEHARADAYVSLAVIASAVVVALGAPVADPLIGLLITVVILRITRQSWSTVRGRHSH
jgi:Co/Zn/Cd efflux system component